MAFNLFKKTPKTSEPAAAPAPEVQAAPAAVTPAGVTVAGGVIVRTHVSEKSSRGHAMGQYTFVVTPKATKPQVATEISRRFKVKVSAVKFTKLPSKELTVGRYRGKVPGIKKAVVVLAAGQSIPVE